MWVAHCLLDHEDARSRPALCPARGLCDATGILDVPRIADCHRLSRRDRQPEPHRGRAVSDQRARIARIAWPDDHDLNRERLRAPAFGLAATSLRLDPAPRLAGDHLEGRSLR